MLAALVAAPGPWVQGYVSEAGSAGQPWASAYRFGLLVLAAGVATLGAGLAPVSRLAAGLLAVASVMAATSGAVPCTDRCPLPPFEPTTVADVVHAAASIVGMVLLAGAMAAVALAGGAVRAALRRLAVAGLVLIVPLGAWLGLLMLFAGRGPVGATVERVILVVAVSWLVGTSVVAGLPAGRRPSYSASA